MSNNLKTAEELTKNETAIILGKYYRQTQLQSSFGYISDTFDKINTLEHVSGYNIDSLINLFAAGYTLEPPASQPPLNSLGELEICKFDGSLLKHINEAVAYRR